MPQCRGCAQTKEVVIERKVCLYAQTAKKWMALKTKTENRRFFPDRMFLGPGRRQFFIEFKKPGGKLHPGQKRMITALRKLGHDVYVVQTVAYGKWIVDSQANGEHPAPVPDRGDWVPSEEA